MDEWKGRSVLITGATGFVGSNLVEALLRKSARVHALVRRSSVPAWIRTAFPETILHEVDLADFRSVEDAVRASRPETIFHLAVRRDSGSAEERLETLRTNVLGTAHLLEAERPEHCRLVCVGGSLEYGKRDRPLDESARLDPDTFYGATKAMAGLLCEQRMRGAGRPLVLLRLFSVYGCREPAHRLIPTAIRAVLEGGELALTEPGYRRDFVFVEDVVSALLLAARKPRACGEVLNVGSGVQTTNEEVVETIQEIAGRRIRIRTGAYPARDTDTRHWVADSRKAREILGWTPEHSLREGLLKTFEWFRTHANKEASAWKAASEKGRS